MPTETRTFDRQLPDLDLRQHDLEPIKVIERCSPLLDNQLLAPWAVLPLGLHICKRKTENQLKAPQLLSSRRCMKPIDAEKVGSISFIITSFLHRLDQSCLLGYTFDVNLDVGKWETLEVHLAPDHVRGIHKCLVHIMKQGNEHLNVATKACLNNKLTH